jgi:hypothetical protein
MGFQAHLVVADVSPLAVRCAGVLHDGEKRRRTDAKLIQAPTAWGATQAGASWNQIAAWLTDVEHLRGADLPMGAPG